MTNSSWKEFSSALATDLYELTMAASYFDQGYNPRATFSLFVRSYPRKRGYLVAAGLEDVVSYLESYRFGAEDIAYLESLKLFRREFLDYLATVRFTGELAALPEGSVFFVDEPVVEITGPLLETQLFESYIINAIQFQTMIASKAARVKQAAGSRRVIDFSLRRTQGLEAGVKVARAAYIAGFDGTSNVLAGKIHGLPVVGTMAHSYVIAFEREIDAFRAFVKSFPENSVLLIDTYDPVEGAHKAAQVAREMATEGKRLKGVRLDSGDMAEISRKVRRVLDEAGFPEAAIFASGGFDEFKVDGVVAAGGAVNSFGVGTKVGVSADAPYLDIAYKLVMVDGRPVMKLSPGKKTLVGPKQIHRSFGPDGRMSADVICLRDEELPGGEKLLVEVMSSGRRNAAPESLMDMRRRYEAQAARLPEGVRHLERPDRYPVRLSDGLSGLQQQVEHKLEERELGES